MVLRHRRGAQHSRCMRVSPWVVHGAPWPEVVVAALPCGSHAVASGWSLQLFGRFRRPTEGGRQLLRGRCCGGPRLPGGVPLIGESTLDPGWPAESLGRRWIDFGLGNACRDELRPRKPFRLEGEVAIVILGQGHGLLGSGVRWR